MTSAYSLSLPSALSLSLTLCIAPCPLYLPGKSNFWLVRSEAFPRAECNFHETLHSRRASHFSIRAVDSPGFPTAVPIVRGENWDTFTREETRSRHENSVHGTFTSAHVRANERVEEADWLASGRTGGTTEGREWKSGV